MFVVVLVCSVEGRKGYVLPVRAKKNKRDTRRGTQDLNTGGSPHTQVVDNRSKPPKGGAFVETKGLRFVRVLLLKFVLSQCMFGTNQKKTFLFNFLTPGYEFTFGITHTHQPTK